MKKVTIKDIAHEAGVSVATVSYVLNNKINQKISPETKKKVLQIVNLYNYTPNQSAVALSARKSGNIAVRAVCPSALWRSDVLLVIDALCRRAAAKGMQVSFSLDADAKKIDNSDAVLCINFSVEQFYKLGEENFIPLIAVESDINDQLFFQVNTKYDNLGKNETYAVLKPESVSYAAHIKQAVGNVVFIENSSQIYELTGKIYTQSQTLYELCTSIDKDCVLIGAAHEKRVDAMLDCVVNAIARNTDIEHLIWI